MGVAETRNALERVLERSLEELTDSGGRSCFPGRQLADWDLPDAAKLALATYGLPRAAGGEVVGFVTEFQEAAEPGAHLRSEDYYVLGRFGSGPIAALRGAGTVRSVPALFTPHPQLAHLYPDGPLAAFVNASVPQFVECAWRYDAVLPLLVRERARAGAAEVQAFEDGRGPDVEDFFEPYQELCHHVLDRFRSVDPEIEPDAGFWAETIVDVW